MRLNVVPREPGEHDGRPPAQDGARRAPTERRAGPPAHGRGSLAGAEPDHSGETAVVRNEDAPAGGTGEPEPPAGRDAPEPGDDNEPGRFERWYRRYRAFTRQDFVHYYDIGPRSADPRSRQPSANALHQRVIRRQRRS